MFSRSTDRRLSYPSGLWLSLLIAVFLHFLAGHLNIPELREVASARRGESDKPVEIAPLPEDLNKTFVQTSKARDQDETGDKPAKYAGEFKNRVKKETKAPFAGRFHEGAQPPPPSPSLQMEGPGEGAEKPAPHLSDLMPFGSTPNVLPDGIAEGTETVLNTDPVLYASFINRIADEIYDPWVTNAREAVKEIYFAGRKLDSNVYVTKLNVLMDLSGKITAIKTLQSSGIPELDEASKKAFWTTEPFQNPPGKMFKSEGTANLVYEFYFHWRTSSFNIVPDLI